jgi:hypothetical protein
VPGLCAERPAKIVCISLLVGVTWAMLCQIELLARPNPNCVTSNNRKLPLQVLLYNARGRLTETGAGNCDTICTQQDAVIADPAGRATSLFFRFFLFFMLGG